MTQRALVYHDLHSTQRELNSVLLFTSKRMRSNIFRTLKDLIMR